MLTYLLNTDLIQWAQEHQDDYIAHQTNCFSLKPHGLSSQVFAAFPHANVYTRENKNRITGTVQIRGNVINMYAQLCPGKPKRETFEQRYQWFEQCLQDIKTKVKPGATIAFPHGCGCGLAGGDWKVIEPLIVNILSPHYNVIIVKL